LPLKYIHIVNKMATIATGKEMIWAQLAQVSRICIFWPFGSRFLL